MHWYYNTLPDVELIRERLQVLIPKNVENANSARNLVAARTIFVMLYGFAIEGENMRVRPSTVTIMSDEQATQQLPEERKSWLVKMQGPKKPSPPDRWYSENTREPIRDDTISTLKGLGAIKEEPGLAVTSSKPRYYLAKEFADLFNPALTGDVMEGQFEVWQKKNLHANAIVWQKLKELEQRSVIEINYSNGKTLMAPGKSSILTKSAIEVFAQNFLSKPSVILISESADKVNWQSSKNLDLIKLSLNPKKLLPDIILADSRDNDLIFVFIEIVNTDGPITTSRKEALLKLAEMNSFDTDKCLFVTVFSSRSDSVYKRVQANLAWGTYVWFADEPDKIIHLIEGLDKQILMQ